MSKQHSVIRNAVTGTLSNILDLASVIVVLFGGAVGYAVGDQRSAALMGLIIGVLAGLAITALLFGTIYLLIEIAEQTKDATANAKLAREENARLLALIEHRLASIEPHIARLDNTQMSDHAAKSVETAIKSV